MTLGETLKKLRLEKKMTQKMVAKEFDISESVVSLYEGDKRSPSYDLLLKFSHFYGVSCDFLLGNTPFLSAKEKKRLG